MIALPRSEPSVETPNPSSLGTRLSVGSAALGGTLLATCLCGIGRIVLGAAAAGSGMASTSIGANLYTPLVASALVLVLVGLAGHSRRAAGRAAVGIAVFGLGMWLAPPAVMHGMRHSAAHLAGFGLTLVGIAALVWGYLTAFPTRDSGAAACAAGGFGAAVGCSCCLASGAATWLTVAAFGFTLPGAPFADGIPYVVFMAVAIIGLYRLAGSRLALLGLAGAALALLGDEGLKPFLADEVERLPRLLVSFVGTAVVMWAFVQAFAANRPWQPVRVSEAPPVRPRRPRSRPRELDPIGIGGTA